MSVSSVLVNPSDRILLTGAGGFIGKRLLQILLERGFTNIRCLARSSGTLSPGANSPDDRVQTVEGNLLSPNDCLRAAQDAKVVYHLAAGRGEKSFADAFANSVVTTRNLLDACVRLGCLKRFVNVSSFAVYSNQNKPRRTLLDEECPMDYRPALRGNAYCFAKVKQEEIVMEYVKKYDLPCVTVRPGVVYGPGNEQIHARVGIGTFGVFLHLGGTNRVPLSYVDNCAEAIALAGVIDGIDGEVFNVIDDDLPTSRGFLRAYKREVRHFRSIYLPQGLSRLACWSWGKLADWSDGQLPNVYNGRVWHATWKKTAYSNAKIKKRLGWSQRVPTQEALQRYFTACREKLAVSAS